MEVLRCTGCGVEKPRTDFWANRAKPTGKQGECKDCIRVRDAKKRRSARGLPDLRRKYPPLDLDADGLAKCVECGSRFRLPPSAPKRRCPSCANKRRMLTTDKVALAAYRSQYRKANKERLSEARKFARLANPATISAQKAARRRAVAEAHDGTLTRRVVRKMFAQCARCAYCSAAMTPSEKTLDHMVPIALGGGHTVANVVVCCLSCNSSKQAMSFPSWVSRLRQRYGEEAASRAERAFRRTAGAPPEQAALALTFTQRVPHDGVFAGS